MYVSLHRETQRGHRERESLYGFNLLNLNSVMLGTFAFNQRAVRCYERVGSRRSAGGGRLA
jgi:hypothetical protein